MSGHTRRVTRFLTAAVALGMVLAALPYSGAQFDMGGPGGDPAAPMPPGPATDRGDPGPQAPVLDGVLDPAENYQLIQNLWELPGQPITVRVLAACTDEHSWFFVQQMQSKWTFKGRIRFDSGATEAFFDDDYVGSVVEDRLFGQERHLGRMGEVAPGAFKTPPGAPDPYPPGTEGGYLHHEIQIARGWTEDQQWALEVTGYPNTGGQRGYFVYQSSLFVDPCTHGPTGDGDADGDGVPDATDRCVGHDDRENLDADEFPDACDDDPFSTFDLPVPTVDDDGDGILDPFDACPGHDDAEDGDGDGIADGCDEAPEDGPLGDLDGDGVANQDDVCEGHDDTADADADSTPDGCDPDDDNDGVPDEADVCPGEDDSLDQDGDSVPDCQDVDRDGDGIDDNPGSDNCPAMANPGQSDLDRDGRGDACDDDIDGDGVANGDDRYPFDRRRW